MDLQTSTVIEAANMTISTHLTQLTSEFQNLLSKDDNNTKTIEDLKFQLETLKTAYSHDVDKLEVDVNKLQNEVDKLNGYSRQVVCLIDGDGYIFSPDIIALGNEGGRQAASKLSDAIQENLSSLGQFQLWVYIFCNLEGLTATLRRYSHLEVKQVRDFVFGFNEASDRFIMVDVGNCKEAADAKLKAHLEDDIRSPQVSKIVFAGCHDDSYATTINTIVTHGLRDKLLFLRGYMKMASGIEALAQRFQCISVPDLFLSEKLGTDSITAGPLNHSLVRASAPPSSPLDFKSALKNGQAIPPTARRSPPVEASKRLPDPTKPLSKQNPAPCILFYLQDNCKWGASCQYGHNYNLQDDHYEELRVNAKRNACPLMVKHGNCHYGKNCVFGHMCPNGPYCTFAKVGSCWFSREGMHNVATPSI